MFAVVCVLVCLCDCVRACIQTTAFDAALAEHISQSANALSQSIGNRIRFHSMCFSTKWCIQCSRGDGVTVMVMVS